MQPKNGLVRTWRACCQPVPERWRYPHFVTPLSELTGCQSICNFSLMCEKHEGQEWDWWKSIFIHRSPQTGISILDAKGRCLKIAKRQPFARYWPPKIIWNPVNFECWRAKHVTYENTSILHQQFNKDCQCPAVSSDWIVEDTQRKASCNVLLFVSKSTKLWSPFRDLQPGEW